MTALAGRRVDKGDRVRHDCLGRLLSLLAARGYRFVTPTPSTCRRMAERERPGKASLRDVLGWSVPFRDGDISNDILSALAGADVLDSQPDGWLRSRVRVSTVRDQLFLHDAFPATAADAVFLGPDSYRFADLIAREMSAGGRVRSIVDVGAGAGVGGLIAARCSPGGSVALSDVNARALELAAVNAEHAQVPVALNLAAGLDAVTHPVDLIVANPPYVAGQSGRTYKDGGEMHGARLALDWVEASLAKLAPGGRFILYTGSAILDGGCDELRERLAGLLPAEGFDLRYSELDPDIFSGELRRSAYADVERIAAVGAVIRRSGVR